MSWLFPRTERHAITPALVTDQATITFGDIETNTRRLANGLYALGLRSGDALGILSSNSIEWVEMILAAIRAGITTVPINWHLATGEVDYLLSNSSSKLLVVDVRHEALGREAAARAGVERVLVLDDAFRTWLEGHDEAGPDNVKAGRVLLYSSGTTGRPKGVVTPGSPTVEQFAAHSAGMGDWYGLREGGTHLVTGPLYHGGPLAFIGYAMATAQTSVIMDGFDPEKVLRLIERHRVTTTYMVPTMFVRMLRLPDDVRAKADVSSLELVLHAAAPCHEWTKRAMLDWFGPVVVEFYGSSEGGGPTKISAEEWLRRPGSVGRPIKGIEIVVVGEDGEPLGPGKVGKLYFRSQAGLPSYLGDADKTADSRLGDLFTVGDIGRVDQDGYLYLADRRVDLILSGGVNVYPAEVEACLSEHPAVEDCAVFGIPDEEWGEQIKAAVELRAGAGASEQELIGWCRERIAHFKCPRSIDFHERLPRTDTGKLARRGLREPYWAEASRPR